MIDFAGQAQIVQPREVGSRLKIWLEPPGRLLSIPRVKTVSQLLEFFKFEPETAIVARNGKLLTPDRHLWPDDEILVRQVGSRG